VADRSGSKLLEDPAICLHPLLQVMLEVGIGPAFSDVLGDRFTHCIGDG
jgi:hypothetical protein